MNLDFMNFISQTLYNCFESLFDEYEELADCVEAVVVTNS